MGILYVIQQDQKGRLSLFPGFFQYILHLHIFIGRSVGDHTLVLPCFRKLIQPFPGNIFDHGIVLSGLPFDGHDRAVLTSILNVNPVNRPARPVRLDHGISSFYCKFLISLELFFHVSFILSLPSLNQLVRA